MPQFINTNVMSINTVRVLDKSQHNLQTSMERLSSGMRINHARDDAAGMAIAEGMTSQIRGMNQAVRNTMDGISLVQVADGALGAISEKLQRVRELAVQAANGTNSSSDRVALDKEVQALLAEVDRSASKVQFNGVKLIDGSFSNQTFQVGYSQGDTINVSSITDANVAALNITSDTGAAGNTTDISSGTTFTITGTTGSTTAAVTITLSTAITSGSDIDTVQADIVKAINAQTSKTGVGASVDASTNKITFHGGGSVTLGNLSAGSGAMSAAVGFSSQTLAPASTEYIDVKSLGGAEATILSVDKALTNLNTARAELGAYQNRFESTVSDLKNNVENLSSARSRIQDADFAAETAALAKNQILQQAGMAMLSQANQLPQNVLKLLQ